MTELKLFIWEEFSPDNNYGLAFAIAEDETEAKELIKEYLGYEPFGWGDLKIHQLTEKISCAVTGGG